jgi:hypothetical protein
MKRSCRILLLFLLQTKHMSGREVGMERRGATTDSEWEQAAFSALNLVKCCQTGELFSVAFLWSGSPTGRLFTNCRMY